MTADRNLLCSRCGFSNIPGDVFCGSCGAFLEWEGQPSGAGAVAGGVAGAGSPAAAPVPDHDPDVPIVGGPSAASEAPTQAFTRPVAPASTPAPPLADADAALIRCPACGVANQAGRTFCQSCGAKLEVTATRVVPVSKEQIAAAVAAPNRPPAPDPRTTASGTRSEKDGSGGIGKWLVVIAILGVLAGVGIVVGMSMLKGEGPASEATAVPTTPGASGGTANATPGASGAPGATADPGATDGPAPTANPAATALALLSATASSVVGDLDKFHPDKAIDGDPATSWQEGAAKEKGEWIEVAFAPATLAKVVIRNGYGASDALFKGNRRLKDILISVDGGAGQSFRLKDTAKAQSIAVVGGPGATTLRITIVSTYAGSKTSVKNTPFDDTAVSEIRVFGVAGT